MAAPLAPDDATAHAAAAAWLEALLAASRPEATWTPSALVAALKWRVARSSVVCARGLRTCMLTLATRVRLSHRAEAVETLAACPAPADGSSTALSAALAAPALSAPLALLGAPRAAHARRELLTALLRSLQLTHGARVAPLLHALEEDCAKGRLDTTLVRCARVCGVPASNLRSPYLTRRAGSGRHRHRRNFGARRRARGQRVGA